MKRFIKSITAVLAAGIFFTACERIDLEGIGELNKIELWYGLYTSDSFPLPQDSVLIDHVEKDLGISLKAVAMPVNKDAQVEMILNAAKNNSLPDIFLVSRDVLTELVHNNDVTRVDHLFPMMSVRTEVMYDSIARNSASYDGVCYGLAHADSIDRNSGIFIRKDWLDKLGLTVPVTLDDYYNVMKAFTEDDPDGNGKDDTYGFGAFVDVRDVEEGLGCRFSPFFGAFGVEGTFNSVRKMAGLNIHKPAYKEAISYIHRLASDGLIDPRWTVYTKKTFQEAWKNGRFGIMVEQLDDFALEQNYKPFDNKFPEGEWILIDPPVGAKGESSVGAFAPVYKIYAVSRRSQELGKLPIIARLLEWMSTDGYLTVCYGEEAENYMVDDEGKITVEGLPNPSLAYTEKIAAPVLQLRNFAFTNSDEELAGTYSVWTTSSGREMNPVKLLRTMQNKNWTLAISKLPEISDELKSFYEDCVKDFVTGRRDMSTWDSWLKEFDKHGGAEWEKRCIAYAEANALLLNNNKIVYKANKDSQIK